MRSMENGLGKLGLSTRRNLEETADMLYVGGV